MIWAFKYLFTLVNDLAKLVAHDWMALFSLIYLWYEKNDFIHMSDWTFILLIQNLAQMNKNRAPAHIWTCLQTGNLGMMFTYHKKYWSWVNSYDVRKVKTKCA